MRIEELMSLTRWDLGLCLAGFSLKRATDLQGLANVPSCAGCDQGPTEAAASLLSSPFFPPPLPPFPLPTLDILQDVLQRVVTAGGGHVTLVSDPLALVPSDDYCCDMAVLPASE